MGFVRWWIWYRGGDKSNGPFFGPDEQMKGTLFLWRGTNQTDLFYSRGTNKMDVFSWGELIKGTFFIRNGINQMDLFLLQGNKSNGLFWSREEQIKWTFFKKIWKVKLKLSRDYESHVTSNSFCKDHFRCSIRWNRNWKYLDTYVRKFTFPKSLF